MNKIIGFFITRQDIGYHFPFKEHFDWIRIEKRLIDGWIVYLWGHGNFDCFVENGMETKIIVGYSEQEMFSLGTEILQNRGALLRICAKSISVENDPIGAMRIFYSQFNAEPNIATVEELVLQATRSRELDRANLVQYLLVGHLTCSQTLYAHVHTMEANQRLTWKSNHFQCEYLPNLDFINSADPVESLYQITKRTILRYSENYEHLFLPLSGGYDSRMLACNAAPVAKISARTYGYSYPLSQAYEVSRAKAVANSLGIKDWQPTDLGCDYIADQGRIWFDIFGTSHHLHGMYHLHFYRLMKSRIGKCLPTLSGYVGDVVAGNQLSDFATISKADSVTKFLKAQFQGPIGFKPDELRRLLNFDIDEYIPAIHLRWKKRWESAKGEPYQKFILTFLRERGRSHISYLCTIADLFGGAITPFIDRKYLSTVIGLPFKSLLNRASQKAVFQKYYPDLWLDDSKFPPYVHYINFLAIKKRGLENIVPVVTTNGVAKHELIDQTYLTNDIIKRYENICAHNGLIQNQYAIRPLYLCNVLQPLFFAKRTDNDTQEKLAFNANGTSNEVVNHFDNVLPDVTVIMDTTPPDNLNSSSQTQAFIRASLSKPESHYDDDYFQWQKSIGSFGGMANRFKFVKYIQPEDTVIDFGCGGGFLLNSLTAKNKMGIEVNENARVEALRNGIFAVEKAALIPDYYADVIISNHALEHVGNPLGVLRVVRRKLKNQGIAVFVVPHQGPKEQYSQDDVNHHLYTWNPQTLGNLFKAAGFGVIKVDTIQHQWPPNYRDIFKKQGEEAFHKICHAHAQKSGNYQIRIVASREVETSNYLAA
jgi:SAM-dependent methyltransferase